MKKKTRRLISLEGFRAGIIQAYNDGEYELKAIPGRTYKRRILWSRGFIAGIRLAEGQK